MLHNLLYCLLLLSSACTIKSSSADMLRSENKNIACDVETGVCAPEVDNGIETIDLVKQEKVKVLYFTDPICSACWAIEPNLRKFKLEYGDYLDIEYKMGGLLPNWEVFGKGGGPISKPSDVAHHWDEIGAYFGMSIDGDIWIEDPLDSSYPPSIAFKAAQKQGKAFAIRYLRVLREMLFLDKKNITKEEYLVEAIRQCGGDTNQFLKDYKKESTAQSFYEEIEESRQMGVRGFPTFIFLGKDGKGYTFSGVSDYQQFINALEQANLKSLPAKPIRHTSFSLLEKYGLLATKEIATLLSVNEETALNELKLLVEAGKVERKQHKFGDYWRKTITN